MINNESLKKNGQKISSNKQNHSLLFSEFCYYKNSGIKLGKIVKLLEIDYRTGKKWEKKMSKLEKIQFVTIDRALNELLFTTKKEIQLFLYLKDRIEFLANL